MVRLTRRTSTSEQVRHPDEFVGQEATADDSLVVVVVVAYGDTGAGSYIVVDLLIEQSEGPAIGMTLQIPTDPVVVVASPVGEESRT